MIAEPLVHIGYYVIEFCQDYCEEMNFCVVLLAWFRFLKLVLDILNPNDFSNTLNTSEPEARKRERG